MSIPDRQLITGPVEDYLQEYGKDILESESFLSLKTHMHHFRSNTYAHCVAVTIKALSFAKKMRIPVHIPTLVRGCLLHDYYLYNHRNEERIKWHLLKHPAIAAENAKRDFNLNSLGVDMILGHMWPINPFYIPVTREGWILLYSDKIVSIRDRFFLKPEKH